MTPCGSGARDEATQAGPRRRPLPEHRDDERGEQRSVEEGEQQLDVVHDVRVSGGDERRTDTDEDADHRDDPAHPQVIDVRPVLDEVRPPQVIGEDRVEPADVGGHAGHEGGKQAGERDPEHTIGQQLLHEQRDGVVVLRLRRAEARDQGNRQPA
jgi:hypothetical protein